MMKVYAALNNGSGARSLTAMQIAVSLPPLS